MPKSANEFEAYAREELNREPESAIMFDLFQSLKVRGSMASLIGFTLLIAGWLALHAFGPSHDGSNPTIFVTVSIVFGALVAGVLLALLRGIFKAAVDRRIHR